MVRTETEEGDGRIDKGRKRNREKWKENRNAWSACFSVCVYLCALLLWETRNDGGCLFTHKY